MDEDKKRAVFEQLKIELRSILLSSKDGVPEHLILSDYEMLSCQRLPYKNLGYKSVASLLGDMPDVAKEIRLASGDVIYKAVSNESTAHIQRLVGNQKSAKKKLGRGRGSFRGHGGMPRGGRGSFRGSLTSRFYGSERGRGGSFSTRGARAKGGGFKAVQSFSSSKENVNPRSLGGSRGGIRSSDFSFAGDVRGNFNNNSKGYRNNSNSNLTGDVRNKDGKMPTTKHSGMPSQDMWQASENECDSGPVHSLDNQSSPESRQLSSPMINLKIGFNREGQRKIVAGSPIKTPQKHFESSEIDAVTPGGQIDLRGWLKEQKQAKGNTFVSSAHPASMPGRKKVAQPPSTQNQVDFQRSLPPRFMKQQQQKLKNENQSRVDFSSNFSRDENPILQEQKALHTIVSKNWVPPEDGPSYLEAYYKYFVDRGEPAPQIKVVSGRVNKEKGFYGQLQYEGICHFPLEILKTEEQAKQNAARCFCITKNIPLPPAQSDGEDYVKFASSEPLSQPCSQPAWMASLTQQMRGSIDLSPAANQQPSSPMASSASSSSFSSSIRTKAESSVVCSQPSKQSQEAVQQSIPAHVDPNIVKKLENIHKMLKPTGVFVKSLPELYLKTYGESLGLDVFPYLQARKDCFNLEETIPGRIIVCPVTEATFKVEFNNNCNSRSSDSKEATSSPESLAASPASSAYSDNRQELQDSSGDTRLQLLEKGSELEVIFSYAYSSSEVYFQLALSEDIIYEIEEVLSQICVTPAPSDWAVPMVGDMVAASYQNGWYRAQICEVNSPKVKVYFFDYGNTESVDISELRPLPQEKVTQMTPPLALRCTLTPKQASFFRVDTHARLEELSTTNPVLRAVVLDNPDHCVVELQLQDGTPVDLHSIPDPLKVKQEQASQLSSSSEPDKLILPDTDAFAVYICQIRTECTVILRVVDTNYSDALDELEKEIADNFYLWPVPEEVKERQIFAAMVLATADEAEDECSIDQNKYHRVLVQHQNKDGSLTCYLPDHGDEETLHRNQLREIDSWLNRSLPYQAVLATLHGLDHVEEALKSITMEILLKLVNFTLPVYAVRYRNSQALEIDIVDTDKDQEVNVNESVKAALEEVREGLSQGKTLKDIMHTMFGSNSGSQADSSSATTPSAATEDDTDDVQASLGRLSVTGDGDEAQSKLKRVQNYVDDLLMNSPGQGAKLYTWNSSKQESPATAQLKALPPLPSYWSYAFFKSVSLYITWVESPSYFVAIPLEQQGALEKVEAAIAQYFSSSAIAAATLSEQGLYAVRSEGKYRRALYMGLVGGMAKIFFPDHHCYDTVEMGEILPLPEQFYSLPFLAYKMRLRAMKPYQCQDWPDKTVSWFKENYSHRALYAVIFSQDGRSASCKHTSGSASNIAPGTLAVRLIDTSGNDDVIVDEMMEQMEMAVNDSSQEQC